MAKAKQESNVGPFTAARYSAEIAADVMNGETNAPDGISRQEYALYLIARALADMAGALDDQARKGVV